MNSFIRKDKVNIARYLPEYLLNDPVFLAMLKAESNEHELQREDLETLLEQFFVTTATESLSKWESFLGIDVDEKKRDEDRRNVIIAKIRGTQTVTLDFMTRLVNTYIADGKAEVVDLPADYSIKIYYHGGQVTDYDKLHQAIKTYIPAHIGYKLSTITRANRQLHCSARIREHNVIKIKTRTDARTSVQPGTLHVRMKIIHSYSHIKIRGGVLTNGTISRYDANN